MIRWICGVGGNDCKLRVIFNTEDIIMKEIKFKLW